MTFSESLTSAAKQAIREALERNGYNQVHAARDLGMHRNTLCKWLRKFGWQEEVSSKYYSRLEIGGIK